jgi:hypothetical protein
MFAMNNATLPLPQPGDWMTIGAAAHLMKVHAPTLDRLIRKGALHSYSPWAAPTEKPPVMLWRDEVLQVHAARQKLAASGAGQ